ncbi:hypothetical protein EQV90_20160 [Pseudomonas sp. TMW22089]|nr:hypothetical protein [Pseudomonas sp. TMW22089]
MILQKFGCFQYVVIKSADQGMKMTKRFLRFYDLKLKSSARYEVNEKIISTAVGVLPLAEILEQAKELFDNVDC